MDKLVPIRLWHIYQLKKVVKSVDTNKNQMNFYSDTPAYIVPKLLSHNCYYLKKGDAIYGVLFLISSKNEICYLPLTSKFTFFDFLYFIFKNINFTSINLSIKYKKLNLNLYRRYFRYRITRDIKRMKLSIGNEYELNQYPRDINGIYMRKMKLNKDEDVRVKLQNSIFGNQIGREKLTVKEVLSEETSQRFLEDKCFILERESHPIGYGQIIFYENSYQLVNFGIIPPEQGKGYAKIFLFNILRDCLESKINEICLTVDNCNVPAIELYKQAGFKELINEASIIMNK